MITVIIERSNELFNRLRDYGVYIDGEKMGTIANGETKQFELSLGEHTLCCKIDWCSSPELKFNTTEDLIKIFKVGAYRNAKLIMPLTSILLCIFLFLKFSGLNSGYYSLAFISIFLLSIYFVTIGRKRYLTLYEK